MFRFSPLWVPVTRDKTLHGLRPVHIASMGRTINGRGKVLCFREMLVKMSSAPTPVQQFADFIVKGNELRKFGVKFDEGALKEI